MRRRNNYRSRIRKESRTIPLPAARDRGNGEDDGRYFRCWNCNSICNIDRDALGGPESRDGLSYEDFPIPVYGADTAVDNSDIARLGGSIASLTVAAVEKIDSTFPVYYPGAPAVNAFTGSLISVRQLAGRTDRFNGAWISRTPVMVGGFFTTTLAIETPLGVLATEPHHIKPVVNTGCWFCGTLNWKGDF